MVAKLVTLAIPHPATLKLSLGKAWGVRHFLTHRLPGAASRFARNNYDEIRVLYERWSPGFAWNDTEFSAARHAYAQPGCMQASLDYYKALTPKMSPGLRARIAAPSLVIGGLSDGIATTADFEGSTRRFTGPIRVQMLPGGHFLHREHPAPFIEALLAFLAE
jgi:pimeloyl-ACP methyl ester carboxylesterase